MALVGENCIELRIMEVNILFLLLHRLDTFAIASSTGGEFLELHDIRGQCSGFVGEYVFNLSQLFVEVTRLGSHLHVLLFVIHCDIVTHKEALPKFDELKGHIQRDWHEVSEDKDPCTEVDYPSGGQFTEIKVVCPLAFDLTSIFWVIIVHVCAGVVVFLLHFWVLA